MSITPKGLLPAMITPLTKDFKPNEKALRKLVDYLIDGGVHGIFALGTTGEFYGLTQDEYKQVLEITMDQTAGRVPVYAGASAITTKEVIALTQTASDLGVDAISVLTPFFIGVNQNELYNHFEAVAKSTDTPILLYDNKPKTNVTIAPKTAAKLADINNIIGIKDSTGDLTNTIEHIRLTKEKDFHVMLGRDSLIYAGMCNGAAGAVAACGNVAPKLCADIYNKYIAGDLEGAYEAQLKLVPLRLAFTLGSFPTVIKEALELQGIEAGPCMAPTGTMSVEEKAQLKKILTEMDLIR